jgi:hypothetical protein
MSFEEYKKIRHESPYKYILKKGSQYLYYFGSRHSYDPKDKQFNEIEAFFNDFIKETRGKDSVILVEGGKRPIAKTQAEAILKGGEMDFVAFLAGQLGMNNVSPEPPEDFRLHELAKHFSKNEIIYYDFARVVYQWNRKVKKPPFEEYLNWFLEEDKQNSGWNDFDFSISHMAEIHKNLFGKEFDRNEKDFFYSIVNPTTEFSVINKISRFEDAGFRDLYILGEIEKYWKEGKNVFVIYGFSHVVMHEPVLRDLVNS